MKKKLLIIILALLAIVGIVAISFIAPLNQSVTDIKFTEKVVVKDGVSSPADNITPFTIDEDGEYTIFTNWEAEKTGMLTGFAVADSNGNIVTAFTAESVQYESKPIELAAGEYEIRYVYIANDDSANAFLKENELAGELESYKFANEGEYTTSYTFELVRAGSTAYRLGFVVGFSITILVGAALILVFLKYTKNDKKIKCEYDERQLQARGNGFKYGFFTHILYSAVLAACSVMEIKIPMANGMLEVFGIILAILVFAVYCIRKNAYISLNENVKKLTIVFLVIGVMNLIIGIMHVIDGTIVENGIITVNALNLFSGICMFFITIVVNLNNKEAADEMEDED